MEKINIALIDDHQIVRQGLKELLEKMGGYKVLYEFDSGANFLEGLPLVPPPDLYILDYSMPHMNGLQVLQALEGKEEEMKVLMLTQNIDENIINQAYHYGARGFLHKNCTAAELKMAIENIVKIGFDNVTDILKRMRHFEDTKTGKSLSQIILSQREQHFLELVCDEKEYTYEQMADIMNVSIKSIEAYRTALFERFNIKSKVGLVLFSFQHKLTKPFL